VFELIVVFIIVRLSGASFIWNY